MTLNLMDPAFLGILGGAAGPTDPHFPNVSLLLHGEGTNGSTTIIDSSSSPKAVTSVGAQISTARSMFGSASIAFNGTSSYITLPSSAAFAFGVADFTIEMFVYLNNLQNQLLYDSIPIGGLGSRSNGFALTIDSNRLNVYSGNSFRGASTIAPPTGQFVYLALVRSGNTWSYRIGAQAAGSFVYSLNHTDTNAVIGRVGDSPAYFLNGHVDEYRITKGVARDVATVPTAAFPDA